MRDFVIDRGFSCGRVQLNLTCAEEEKFFYLQRRTIQFNTKGGSKGSILTTVISGKI